jgi:hypothetical protein
MTMTSHPYRGSGGWRRVTPAQSCPVCRKPDWCSVSADGTVAACRRVEAGCWRSKTDRAGAPVYLHRLDGTGGPPPEPLPPPGGPAPARADADALHRVYSALLGALPPCAAHRDGLRRRGLADAEIDRRGYGTLPVRGRAGLAHQLGDRFGHAVRSVPGLFFKQGEGGRLYLTLAGYPGLLVPVRDVAGRVVALLVRRDDAGDGPRYSYLSSTRHGGPGPGAPAHVPRGITAPAEVVRVTEGVLKGDVAHALSGLPTVGVPGVGSWRTALPALRALGARASRLAFDADAAGKPAVARALAAAFAGLAAAGLAVELERWPAAAGKGIDDLLAGGGTPELLAGDAARAALAEIVADGTAGEAPPSPLERPADVLAAGPGSPGRRAAASFVWSVP